MPIRGNGWIAIPFNPKNTVTIDAEKQTAKYVDAITNKTIDFMFAYVGFLSKNIEVLLPSLDVRPATPSQGQEKMVKFIYVDIVKSKFWDDKSFALRYSVFDNSSVLQDGGNFYVNLQGKRYKIHHNHFDAYIIRGKKKVSLKTMKELN
jgi:hypothetical protein